MIAFPLIATMEPCPGEFVSSSEFTVQNLFEKKLNTQFKWKLNGHRFNELKKRLQKQLLDKMQASQSELERIPEGSIRMFTSHVRSYNINNLTTLLRKHGFNSLETFLTERQGHLIRDLSHAWDEGGKQGLLFRIHKLSFGLCL